MNSKVLLLALSTFILMACGGEPKKPVMGDIKDVSLAKSPEEKLEMQAYNRKQVKAFSEAMKKYNSEMNDGSKTESTNKQAQASNSKKVIENEKPVVVNKPSIDQKWKERAISDFGQYIDWLENYKGQTIFSREYTIIKSTRKDENVYGSKARRLAAKAKYAYKLTFDFEGDWHPSSEKENVQFNYWITDENTVQSSNMYNLGMGTKDIPSVPQKVVITELTNEPFIIEYNNQEHYISTKAWEDYKYENRHTYYKTLKTLTDKSKHQAPRSRTMIIQDYDRQLEKLSRDNDTFTMEMVKILQRRSLFINEGKPDFK